MALNAAPLPGLDALSNFDTTKDPKGFVKALQQILRFIWDRIFNLQTLIKAPNEGKLNPDQKPQNLGVGDAGTLFFSTDFNRQYRWTGTAWEDAPSAPARFMTAFFIAGQTPQPSTGWAICNGASVNISTTTGKTAYFTTPNIAQDALGQFAWVRL